jgi:3-oxoacyl-[acyl-carrier-protein] synthase-1
MSANLAVVGVGARTPVGLTAESAAAAVRAGIRRIAEHPFMVEPSGSPLLTARDARLEPTLLGWRRLAALAAPTILGALANIASPNLNRLRLAVILALPEPRPGMLMPQIQQVAGAVRDSLSKSGLSCAFDAHATGHAGALDALVIAADRLSRGQADLVVVGGVDSYLEADTLDWLVSKRRLAAEGVRAGFHPGEAAGALVLASADSARRLGLAPQAMIRGAHSCMESRSLLSETEVLGEGLAAAITTAGAALRLPEERVDAIYCDINGERYRSDEWALTVLRAQHVFRGPAYQAPAECWGDVGAASGALGCVLAISSWALQHASGPRALVWAGSDGGLRGAAVLERAA